MRAISKQRAGCASHAFGCPSLIAGLTRVLVGILFLVVLHNPVKAPGATVPGSYSVTLAWDGSPSPEVAGYRLYYGPASGTYTNTVAVGNATAVTVPGLAGGTTYFFAVTAYTVGGLESSFSNEIAYTPGIPGVNIHITPARQFVLTVIGDAGRTYDILASQDLQMWTIIGTVTVGPGGSFDFTDTNAASFPTRFYRTRETP